MRTSLHFRLSLVFVLALGLLTNLQAQEKKECDTQKKVECIKKESHSSSWENFSVDEPISYAQSLRFHNDYNNQQGESRAFFGVYPATGQDGVLLTDVVRGTGAEAAGLRSGDVIINLAGESVVTNGDFTNVLRMHEPDERVRVLFVREGQIKETTVLLTDKNNRSSNTERDPCKVFIGVNISNTGYNDRGVRVSNIISGTPAEVSRVQAGDIITALDDVNVYSFNELLAERNKHEAGDYFTLNILREGAPIKLDARFKVCDEPKEEPTIVEVPTAPVEPITPTFETAPELGAPTAPTVIEEMPSIQDVSVPDFDLNNTLPVVEWRVFPNPTVSRVRVNFRAEAIPTTVQVVDVMGKVIYREQLNNFSGSYNQEINFDDAIPGGVFLQVIQGDLVKTEKIVLLDRA